MKKFIEAWCIMLVIILICAIIVIPFILLLHFGLKIWALVWIFGIVFTIMFISIYTNL
jgi:hypothetical protein